MDKLHITGGSKLFGDVYISGAKNAALPILAATLLTDEPVTLHNVPNLQDVRTFLNVLQQIGVHVHIDAKNSETITLHAKHISKPVADYDLVKKMRASILVLGPLLARCGNVVCRYLEGAPLVHVLLTNTLKACKPWVPIFMLNMVIFTLKL
jgi:UDP-N-acetylglucosamine 1-carboxyvinyltransferase